jgi:hypothetical protein
MAEFNLLKDSFIQNVSVSGNFRELNSEEIDKLITVSGSVLTLSGEVMKLWMDLGAQKSVKNLTYYLSPVSASGLTVEYGRDLGDYTVGTVITGSSTLTVEPTISGYTFPRYFQLTHSVASGSTPITINGLEVINTEDEVNYGNSGTLESISLVGDLVGGYSEVTEVPIVNSGTVPSDIYTTLDTSFIDNSLLENFELATTSTGTFRNFNLALEIPTTIPWEWGIFENTTIEDEALKAIDPNNILPDFQIGEERQLISENSNAAQNDSHTENAADPDGNPVLARLNNDHSISFTNPLRNTRTTSTTPSYTPSDDNERKYADLAWDGDDCMYFLSGKDDQKIQKYEISTNTFSQLTVTGSYNRRSRAVAYYDGYLYLGGGQSSAGSSSDTSDQFWKYRISDGTEEQLNSLWTNTNTAPKFVVLDTNLYYITGDTDQKFYKFDLVNEVWTQLANHPVTFPDDLSPNFTENEIWLSDSSGAYSYDILTNTWSTARVVEFEEPTNPTSFVNGVVGIEDSVFCGSTYSISIETWMKVLDETPEQNLGLAISGSWISPVFKVDSPNDFHRILLYVNALAGAEVKFDESIGVENYQIRGSDSSPSAENTFQNFGESLDPDEFVTGILSDTAIVSSGNELTFSHAEEGNNYNTGYVYYGFPLNTQGEMQYKFWWSPPTDRLAGSEHYSRFYIVPYLDILGGSSVPDRNPNTLERLGGNYIYLQYGDQNDSQGSFSKLTLYNGVSTQDFSISAESGRYYEVTFIINWENGSYKLYFDSNLISTGTIPLISISELGSQHSYELFSAGETVNFEEKYKYLTVNRVGLEAYQEADIFAIPMHRSDPLFGEQGSLDWTPITVNSPILPKTAYIQMKLTLRSTGGVDSPVVEQVKFPYVLKLEDVAAGESSPVYVRYLFPAANDFSTNTLRLRSWMATDKL